MNEERAIALLKWINSVSGTSVLFIRDFGSIENVKILVKALHLIDKDSIEVLPEDNTFTIEVVLSFLLSYLGGFYHQKLDGIVNTELIAVDADEIEIGKLITLLLCGAAQCDNVNFFIGQIQNLEQGVQFHVKEIIETVLKQMEHGGLDGEAISNLLKSTTKDTQESNGDAPVFSPAPGPLSSPTQTMFSNSPLMSLMSSPQLKNKQNQFAVNKMHQKISKLQMALDAQTHVQTTLEDELAEKNKEIDAKDGKMKELSKEIAQLKMAIDDLESAQDYKTDYEKLERDNERLKQRVAELEDFKAQSGDLEKRFAEFLEEKELFDKKVEDMDQLESKCERYKTQLHHSEFHASELKAALSRKEVEIAKMEKERDEALHAASEWNELWKARGPTESPEHSPDERYQGDGIPVDQLMPPHLDSRVIELEFANEKLRNQLASVVDPSEVQRLRDNLEDTERSRRSYEEKYVEVKSKILELEDTMHLIETQAKMREDGLTREIEDVNKALQASQEKLAHSRKDLSRVQTELSEAQSEVNAHVIVLEKERATASKTLDEVLDARKAAEQLAATRYSELRQEMDAKERQAEEQLETVRKECDTRIRRVTDELQGVLEANRDEMRQKREEFAMREEELQKNIVNVESEREAAKKAYEEMLSNLKTELESEVKYREILDATMQQERTCWKNKEAEFHEEIKSKESELAALKGEERQLQEDTSRLNEEILALVQKNKEVEELKDNLEKEVSSLEDLQQKGNEERSAMSKEILEMKQHADKLNQEKTALEEAVASLSQKQDTWLKEREQISLEVLSLKDAFASEMQTTKEDLETKHNDNLGVLRKVNEDAKQKLREREQNVEELTEAFSRMKKEMDNTESKLLEVTRERNKTEKELLSEKRARKESESHLKSELDKRISENAKEMRDVMAVLEKERQLHEKKTKEMEGELDRACVGLKAAADEIEQLKSSKEDSETKLVEQQAGLRDMQHELEILKDSNTKKEKKQVILEEAYESDKTFWRNKLDGSNEEVMKLTKELYENSQKHSSELMDVQRQVQDKERELESLKNMSQQDVKQLQGKLTVAEESILDLQNKVKEGEIKLVTSEDAKAKLTSVCKDLGSKLKESLEKIKQTESDMEGQIQKLKEEHKQELEDKTQSIETLNREIVEIKANIVQVEEEKKLEVAKVEDEASKRQSEEVEKVKAKFEKEMSTAMEEQRRQFEEEQKAKEVELKEVADKNAREQMEKLTNETEQLRTKVEETEKTLKELEENLLSIQNQRDEVKKEFESCKSQFEEKEGELASKLSEAERECEEMKEDQDLIKRMQEEIAQMEEHINVLREENENLEEQIKEEHVISKRLGMQVNSLEAQVKHADTTIREQKSKLHEYQENNSKKTKQIMLEVEKLVPVDGARDFLDDSTTTTESDDSEMKMDDLGGLSRQSSTVSFASTTEGAELTKSVSGISRASLRSNNSANYARAKAARRQSALYVKGETSPARRTTSAFIIMRDSEFLKNFDEEEPDPEWSQISELDRLAELERRNTICPPHLKTSYPVETQTQPFDEKRLTLHATRSETALPRKRKSEEEQSTRTKQRKDGMISSKSEGEIKRSKSKRIQDMVSSKITSLRSKSNENLNKEAKKTGNSVAFVITPPKKGSKASSKNDMAEASEKRDSFAFTIENSPPKKPRGVQRTRTINRSTASTQLIRDKDKEIYKQQKKQESRNRIPLRSSNKKINK